MIAFTKINTFGDAHSHPTPTDYFTVKSGQEKRLAPVIAMNYMCYKFFLYFFRFQQEVPVFLGYATVNASVDRLTRATKKLKTLVSCCRVMLRPTDIRPFGSKFGVL